MVSLAAGDPNFKLPQYIAQTVYDAIMDGCNHYNFGGETALKDAIAEYYSKYGYKPDNNQIVITGGGNPGLSRAMATVLNAGEENLTPDPSYNGCSGMINFLGGKNVRVPMKVVGGLFRPDINAFNEAITPKTKSIYLDNPGNPSGCVLSDKELKGLAELAVDNNLIVISDETYSDYVWDGAKHRALITYPGMENRVIVVSALTKMYSWAGMRTGWTIAGPELAPYVSSAPGGSVSWPIQKGAVVALTKGWKYHEDIKKEYDERLNYGVKRLNEIPGITCTKPEGAFYLYANIKATGLGSVDFGNMLRDEEAVRISGSTYGEGNADGYVRLSMIRPLSYQKMPSWFEMTPDTTFEAAMDRIESFIKRHLK
jgi:aspartate/methionine/tyrosine aminotransferase